MKYNFDEIVDRSRNRSAKYDEAGKKFGSQDVIPLWIADMDFKTAQPVIDALKARAEEGIWGYTSVRILTMRLCADGRSAATDGTLTRA